MEFLVEFEIEVPPGTPESVVEAREREEAAAAAELVEAGHLVRVWRRRGGPGPDTVLGLYRADGREQLDGLLGALPLADWMRVTVTPLLPHPNDPAPAIDLGRAGEASAPPSPRLPDPHLTLVYRLEASLGPPLELGEVAQGRRRIVPLTGGTFTGPGLAGTLLPGASADWQIVRPDGTALGDIRYTLRTDRGDLLYIQSRGVRHGPAEVLERLGRGEEVDASEYTFRTSTRIETAAPDLDWVNKCIFIGVGGRRAGGVIYETYLVG
jgi:muconolactone delta-isomerase